MVGRSAQRIPPFHWWRTVFFLIPAISVYTIVLGTLSIGWSVLGGSGNFGHRCARAWSWLILATTGVVIRVSGRDRLEPRTYVFISNHQSIYDIPIIFWSLPFQLRIIAKASLGRFPILGWHLRRTGHVLVDRAKPGHVVFRRIGSIMQRGLSPMVFPEGTRSVDGKVGRFKKAIFVLAIDAGLPIVPVSVSGSREVMKPGGLMTRPGTVELTVHEPIDTSSLSRDDAAAFTERVQRIIESGVDSSTRQVESDSDGDLARRAGASS